MWDPVGPLVRRVTHGAAVLVAAVAIAVMVGAPTGPLVAPTGALEPVRALAVPATSSTDPIDHVVIVFQENHVYDNYFGTYCLNVGPYCSTNATGIPPGTCVPMYPTNPAAGCVRPYLFTSANVTNPQDLVHDWDPAHEAYDNGSMDGFYLAEGKHLSTFGHFDGTLIPTYWDLAEEYGLGDNFYASVQSYSTPNHWYLLAGQSPAIGINQTLHKNSADPLELTDDEEEYLNESNSTTTIEDLLVNSSTSWKYYDYSLSNYTHAIHQLSGAGAQQSAFDFWNPLAARAESYQPGVINHFVPSSQFFTDAANGSLPNVSWVLPTFNQSDHPGSNLRNGETWVGGIVNAVENSPEWNHTVVFVTWDDYGGDYDHLPPPVLDGDGVSFRVPLLVIGPYVRENFVSHHFESFDSLLHFVEWRFGLPSITARDADAALPLEYFDFNATPRAPMRFLGPYNAVYPIPLQGVGPPPRVASLSASAGPASVTLNWSLAESGASATALSLTYGPAGQPNSSRLRIDPSGSTTTVGNLAGGVPYGFWLSALTGTTGSTPAYAGATPSSNRTLPVTSNATSWVPNVPLGNGGPPLRRNATLAFDAMDGYYLLFGGRAQNGSFLGDTWALVNGVWLPLSSPVSPAPRQGAVMTYDAADGYVLLFGGSDGRGPMGDTWEFVHGVWTNVTSTAAGPPSARAFESLTYDSTDKVVVMFGGLGAGSNPRSDTWKFTHGKWTALTPKTSPGARWAATLTNDPTDGYMVLFGGNASAGAVRSDTWKYLRGVWTKLATPTGLHGRAGAEAAFDGTDNYILLTGGWGAGGFASTTWAFHAGAWTNVSGPAGPPLDSFGSAAFDSVHMVTLLGLGVTPTGWMSGWWIDATPLVVRTLETPMDLPGPGAVVFTAYASGGSGWWTCLWTFGDGASATILDPTHVYATPGNFTVLLTITDHLGQSATIPMYVEVAEPRRRSSVGFTRSRKPSRTPTLGSTTGTRWTGHAPLHGHPSPRERRHGRRGRRGPRKGPPGAG